MSDDLVAHTIPITPQRGTSLDLFVEEVSFVALRLCGADPRAVVSGDQLIRIAGSFAEILELGWVPGRVTAFVELGATPSAAGITMTYTLALGALGITGSTASQALAFGQAARRTLSRFPAPYLVRPVDPARLFEVTAAHVARIGQRLVSVSDETQSATALSRFDRRASSWLSLAEALADRESPTRMRSTMLATELGVADFAALRGELTAAKQIAGREEPDAELAHRARRVEITLLDTLESFRTPLFIGEVVITSETELPDVFLREVAGSITRELDVIQVGETPTVAARSRLVGGFTIERDPPAQIDALRVGLPLRGGLRERELSDLLSLTEAACAFQWPVPAGGAVVGVPTERAIALPAPAGLPDRGVIVGRDPKGVPFRVDERLRTNHIHLVGATGTGKSTVIATLAKADLEDGRGFVLVEPHGDLARSVADMASAMGREVVVIDPTDPDTQQVSLFQDPGPGHDTREEVISRSVARVVEALTSHAPPDWAGPRFHAIARAALTLIAYSENMMGLPDVSGVLSDPDALRAALKGWDGPRWVIQQLELFHNDRNRAEVAHWAASKFDDFSMSVSARRVLAPVGRGIEIADAIHADIPVIVNLAKGATSALDARLLGHVVVSSAVDAALARPVCERSLYSLFVDEIQSFPPQSLELALAEGRKFGLGVVAAHQHLAQLAPSARDALMGNAGARLCFRLSANDAVHMGEELGVQASALSGQPDLHALARVSAPGMPATTFSLEVDSPFVTVADEGRVDRRAALSLVRPNSA